MVSHTAVIHGPAEPRDDAAQYLGIDAAFQSNLAPARIRKFSLNLCSLFGRQGLSSDDLRFDNPLVLEKTDTKCLDNVGKQDEAVPFRKQRQQSRYRYCH